MRGALTTGLEHFIDTCFLRLLEAERLEKLSKDLETARLVNDEMSTGNPRVINSSDLSPLTADLCGVLIPRLRGMVHYRMGGIRS